MVRFFFSSLQRFSLTGFLAQSMHAKVRTEKRTVYVNVTPQETIGNIKVGSWRRAILFFFLFAWLIALSGQAKYCEIVEEEPKDATFTREDGSALDDAGKGLWVRLRCFFTNTRTQRRFRVWGWIQGLSSSRQCSKKRRVDLRGIWILFFFLPKTLTIDPLPLSHCG